MSLKKSYQFQSLSLYQNVKSFCKKCVCGIAEECCGEPTVFIPSPSFLLLSLKWEILVIGSDRSPKFLCSAIKLEPPQGRTQTFKIGGPHLATAGHIWPQPFNIGASPGHSWPHLATTFLHRGLTWPQLATSGHNLST